MIGPGMMLAGAVAAPVIGGLVGNIMGSSDRKRQQAAMAAAYGELAKLGLPPDLSKEIILQQFQSQGILTPELEQDLHLEASKTAQITEDKGLRDAQMDVLGTLGQQSRGGFTAQDRASYNEMRASVQKDAEAKRQQIRQTMSAQGMGGSGADLISQLMSGQQAEDLASRQSDTIASEASKRAMDALMNRGQMAGSVRSQDFGVAQAKAAAEDDRNKFLFQNSTAMQTRNTAAQNAAQQANLANKQRLSEMNVGQGNTESLRQNQAKRDYWQDQLGLAQAKANALVGQAGAYGAQAQASQQMGSGIGNAVGQGFATYGAYNQAKAAPTQAEQLAADRDAIVKKGTY